MARIVITGCGTDVGKTVVSAICAKALNGEYWKPIQCGESDAQKVRDLCKAKVHPPSFDFSTPCSPHHAAKIEKLKIESSSICLPTTRRPLIIETAGGIFVPLNNEMTTLDLFQNFTASWVVVSRHYLGSINHTLLTLSALKARNIDVHLLIFNGAPYPEAVEAICQFSNISAYLELDAEKEVTPEIICNYAKKWKRPLEKLLH